MQSVKNKIKRTPNRRKRRGLNPRPVQINEPVQHQLHDHFVQDDAEFWVAKHVFCHDHKTLMSIYHVKPFVIQYDDSATYAAPAKAVPKKILKILQNLRYNNSGS